jgi:hypothetical protein
MAEGNLTLKNQATGEQQVLTPAAIALQLA